MATKPETTRPRMIKKIIDNDVGQIRFEIVGGDTLTVDVTALPAEIREYAAYHGLLQKIGDAAALDKGSTPAEKQAAMEAVIANLRDGIWNVRGSGDGEGRTPGGIMLAAYAEFIRRGAAAKKLPAPDDATIAAQWAKQSPERQREIYKTPAIAAIAAEIRAAKSGAVDTEALLADLGI